MTLVVRFSDEAIDDLEEIESYIATDSPLAAARVIVQVYRRIESLSDFPHLGKASGIKSSYKISVARLPYLIIYEIRPRELWILRVYHSSRNMNY